MIEAGRFLRERLSGSPEEVSMKKNLAVENWEKSRWNKAGLRVVRGRDNLPLEIAIKGLEMDQVIFKVNSVEKRMVIDEDGIALEDLFKFVQRDLGSQLDRKYNIFKMQTLHYGGLGFFTILAGEAI